MNSYLNTIIEKKYVEINKLKSSKLNRDIIYCRNKSFKKCFNGKNIHIIGEIKRKSPSTLEIAKIKDPLAIAKQYLLGGASAISVLTDKYGFKGTLQDLSRISTYTTDLSFPVLRKDFILDPIQIDESILAGADVILLIVSILGAKTKTLFDYARSCGMETVIEVYNLEELKYAVSIGAEIILVNNRNLNTFEVDTMNAKRLIHYIPKSIIAIAASGISNKTLVQEYQHLGYRGVLMGESLIKQTNIVEFLKSLRESS